MSAVCERARFITSAYLIGNLAAAGRIHAINAEHAASLCAQLRVVLAHVARTSPPSPSPPSTNTQLLASASYDSYIHLMFDDPDSDWTLLQKLRPSLDATELVIPSSASPSLLEALSPTEPEKEAQSLDVPPLREPETVWALAWSPDGRYLASGGDQGGIRLWERVERGEGEMDEDNELGEMEVATGMEVREVQHTAAHAGAVFALSWGPGPTPGGLLASAAADGRIIVWEVVEGKLSPVAGVREAHGVADINGVGWNAREDGKGAGLLASAADDGSVKVWRVVADA